MSTTLLIVIILIVLFGGGLAMPAYRTAYGYPLGGGLGIVLLVLLILFLTGRLG